MVSVQPQLSLVFLFLTFHLWWGLREGCPIGTQQKGENPKEVLHPICQYCYVSQLQAGQGAGVTDRMDDNMEKF